MALMHTTCAAGCTNTALCPPGRCVRAGQRIPAAAILPPERACCGTFKGSPHRKTCPEFPLGRHCQNGGDVCLAGNADGVACPEDGCDIDDGARSAPKVEAQPVAPAADKWEGAEEWMPLAWKLCADENGEEACSELVWEGGPVPEPWGDRWLKYEDEAKRLIRLVREFVPALQPAALAAPRALTDGDEALRGQLGVLREWIREALGPLEVSEALIDDEDGGASLRQLIEAGQKLAAVCPKRGADGKPCGLLPPCPDCGRAAHDVPEGA